MSDPFSLSSYLLFYYYVFIELGDLILLYDCLLTVSYFSNKFNVLSYFEFFEMDSLKFYFINLFRILTID